jgi:YD repeat-containing protein
LYLIEIHFMRIPLLIQSRLLISLIIVIAGCNDDEGGPGTCRVTVIRYQRQGTAEEVRFEYDDSGRLISMNSLAGPTCREKLFYDDNDKLIRRTLECSGQLMSEATYNYSVDGMTSITNRGYYNNRTSAWHKYFNGDSRVDSIIHDPVEPDSRASRFRFEYSGPQLTASQMSDLPCCREYAVEDIIYDNAINPYYLLQQAAHATATEPPLGYLFASILPEDYSQFYPTSYKWLKRWRFEHDTSIILEEEKTDVSFTIEYHNNSLYPAKVTRFENGQPEGSSILFFYDDCW